MVESVSSEEKIPDQSEATDGEDYEAIQMGPQTTKPRAQIDESKLKYGDLKLPEIPQ
jgi:hypothetical protein